MSLSSRDKKLVMVIFPAVLIVAFWFLLLSPKREEARKAGEALVEQQQRRDDAATKLRSLGSAQSDFAADYATVVRLGKAIPSSVDEPSLLVQLDRAARGTDIEFRSVKAGDDDGAAAAPSTPSGPSGGSGGSEAPADTSTSKTAKPGAVPVGGAAADGASAEGQKAPGLENVPLDFEFVGSYFDLSRFFHRMKRFVYVRGDGVRVRGRLMTLDSLKLIDKNAGSGNLTAEIGATVYLSPKAEGPTAGATPEGPATAEPASSSASTPSSSTPPTAVASP